MKTRLGYVAISFAGCTAIAGIFALPNIANGVAWRVAVLNALAQWWSWGLLAPVVFAIDGRLPFSGKQLPKRLVAHLILSLLATAIYTYVFAVFRALMGVGKWRSLFDAQTLNTALRGMFLWSWLIYWVAIGAWQAWQYYQRFLSSELDRERMERQFTEARLNALRMQLDPHFLFNALNTISSQMERDPRLARRMMAHLGDLLRLSLETRDRQEIPLAEEMAFLEHYLAIQRIRFGDRLRIETRIAPETESAAVPCLFVQPLVENAIRHGISPRSSGGAIVIAAERIRNTLQVTVLDDGLGLPPGWSLENAAGLGLSITRDRIAGIHANGDCGLCVEPRATGGTEVRITLPFRTLTDRNALA